MFAIAQKTMYAISLSLAALALAALAPSQARAAEPDGWAQGTVGGKNGAPCVVDTLGDHSQDGQTLRECLESPGPTLVSFSVSGTITLRSTIQLQNFKTIDATGRNIRIDTNGSALCDGNSRFHAFEINSKEQIIIQGLNFDDAFAAFNQDCEGSKAILIRGNSKNIFITHNRFARWADTFIQVEDTADKVTISYNRMEQQFQGIKVSSGRVTVHHNLCNGVSQRCPGMVDGPGRVHAYNNVVCGWGSASAAISRNMTGTAAQYFLERNYLDGAGTVGTIGNCGTNGGSTNLQWFGSKRVNGAVEVACNAVNQSFIDDSRARATSLVNCGTDACWTALYQDVQSHAGP